MGDYFYKPDGILCYKIIFVLLIMNNWDQLIVNAPIHRWTIGGQSANLKVWNNVKSKNLTIQNNHEKWQKENKKLYRTVPSPKIKTHHTINLLKKISLILTFRSIRAQLVWSNPQYNHCRLVDEYVCLLCNAWSHCRWHLQNLSPCWDSRLWPANRKLFRPRIYNFLKFPENFLGGKITHLSSTLLTKFMLLQIAIQRGMQFSGFNNGYLLFTRIIQTIPRINPGLRERLRAEWIKRM